MATTKTRVTLPEGDFVTVLGIASAIAEALHPLPEIEVIRCLIQEALNVDPECRGHYFARPLTPEQCAQLDADMKEAGFDGLQKNDTDEPYYFGELTKAEYDIWYYIPDTPLGQMFSKWKIQDDLGFNWRPVLTFGSNFTEPKKGQDKARDAHVKALCKSIQDGKLSAIDEHGAPTTLEGWSADSYFNSIPGFAGMMGYDTRIKRLDAVAYVIGCGFEVVDEAPDADVVAAIDRQSNTTRFKADERHRQTVEHALKNQLNRPCGTRPSALKEARDLKSRARDLLVKGAFTESNFNLGWKLLPRGD